MTLTKVLRDNGVADRATVHGFRSAFRDWCAETGAPREVAEAALAHTVGGSRAPTSAPTCSSAGGRSWSLGTRSWRTRCGPMLGSGLQGEPGSPSWD